MNINMHLMLAGITLLATISYTKSQDCVSYVTITDSRRSTKQVSDGSSPISDKDLDPAKWYRFKSYIGNSIPERAPGDVVESNRCGTTYPVYIIGLNQHPTQDDETKKAIVQMGNQESEITIHQCPPDKDLESYYVYNLVPAPANEIAYCAGEGEPCQPGYMHNGFGCVNYHPIMKGQPIFSDPLTTGENANKEVYYKCQVQYDRVTDDFYARFMVTFLFDGFELEYVAPQPPHKYLPSFTLGPEGDISANLTEYYLQGRLGKTINCKVRSFWEGNSEKGNAIISVNSHKATLEAVEIFDFDQSKGEKQIIRFTPTLPFTYFHCSKYTNCPTQFIYVFYLSTDVATNTDDCSIMWNGTHPELIVEIKPFAGSRLFQVKFQPYDSDYMQDFSSLWNNFVVPPVTINAFHSTEKVCKSTSDPHITTFDVKKFDNMLLGDFYLVRADVDMYKLEIQVRQEQCNGKVACNCAVIVREINSVVQVGYVECDKWDSTTARPIDVIRLLTQDPDDGTSITRDDAGRKFSVRMPSGTRVEISAVVPWFNVDVHLAPIYHGKTFSDSMCGNSNGNPDDDESTDSEKFRITDISKSYFAAQPECYDVFYPGVTTCECSESHLGANCSNVEQNLETKTTANVPLPTTWSSGVTCVAQGRAYLDKHSSGENNADFILDPEDLFQPYVPDPDAGHNITLSWPTPLNKTEEEVVQYCMTLLKGSPVFSDCNTVAKTDLTIRDCVTDIQIADEYFATNSYTDSFEQECVNVLIEQEANATAGGPPPTVNVTTLHAQICPAQCSGHGTCVNASCICSAGFIGADCSIDETKPPVLSGIARSGVCDIQERPCATVSVFGSGIVSSPTLKCRFSAMQGSGPALETNGTLITSSEVSCSVPNITSERPALTRQGISITNDGAMYGNIQEFVTFDSVCMSCGKDKVCTQKTDACLISDRCYVNGATGNPEHCQQCVASQSISSWTIMPVTENLQACSRTCDYGAQLKETVCTINNTVINTEPLLCQTSSCAAIPEEDSQGIIMTLSNEDTTKILLTPTLILSEVAKVVNNYCSAHATQCCNSVGVPNGVSLSSFTSLELCPYGSGYPQVGDASSRIKVIVKIIPSQVQSECVQSAPQHSSDGEEAYADPDIIFTAVAEGKDAIEQALNVTIVSVEKDSGSHSSAGLPTAKHALVVVTAFTAFLLHRRT